MKNIPYGKQYIDKYDKKFVLDSQNNFITTGLYVKKLEDKLKKYLNVNLATCVVVVRLLLHLVHVFHRLEKMILF